GPGSSGATPTSPRCSRRPAAEMARFRVGVDIGGTFTDIVFLDDDGTVHTKKVSSSVDDYARAIVEGIRELFHETGVTGHDGNEALAVCLLNAYANPAHEQQIKAIVERRVPGMPFCISTDVLPEIREYERSSTTVINAYVMPVVQRYLRTLRAGLGEIAVRTPLLIIQSNGGLMTAEAASRMPMHIIESGPAAGVIGAQALARRTGMAKIITFDM